MQKNVSPPMDICPGIRYNDVISPKGGNCMQFLYLLEKIRVPGLNELMLTITHLGE